MKRKRNKKLVNFNATKRFEYYNYDTVEDMRAHRVFMERKGYVVWDYNEEEFYAEYEMCETANGSVEMEV